MQAGIWTLGITPCKLFARNNMAGQYKTHTFPHMEEINLKFMLHFSGLLDTIVGKSTAVTVKLRDYSIINLLTERKSISSPSASSSSS